MTSTEPASNLPTRPRQNREAILSGRRQLAEIDAALDEWPRLREALAHFRNAHLDARLDERSRVDRERRVLDTAAARLGDVLTAAQPPAALRELPNATILARIADVLGALRADVTAAADMIDRAVAAARTALSSIDARPRRTSVIWMTCRRARRQLPCS